jgi:hypothetical protein
MTGGAMHGTTRRVALLSTMAAILAPLSAKAYYQIWQLISPELVAIGLWVAADDRALSGLVQAEQGEKALVEYTSARLRQGGVTIPVMERSGKVPPEIHAENIVYANLRADLQPSDAKDGPPILGSAQVIFERNAPPRASLHPSAYPHTLFTASRDAGDLNAKVLAAAKMQLDRTLIPQLIAEKR